MTHIWIRTIVGLVYFILCGFVPHESARKKAMTIPANGLGWAFFLAFSLYFLFCSDRRIRKIQKPTCDTHRSDLFYEFPMP